MVAQFVKPFLGGKYYTVHFLILSYSIVANSRLANSGLAVCKSQVRVARTGLRSNVFLRLSQVINKGRSKRTGQGIL